MHDNLSNIFCLLDSRRKTFMYLSLLITNNKSIRPPQPNWWCWYAQNILRYSPISMKKITSTIESTTNNETSSEVLFLKATLYGTWNGIAINKKKTKIRTTCMVKIMWLWRLRIKEQTKTKSCWRKWCMKRSQWQWEMKHQSWIYGYLCRIVEDHPPWRWLRW